jgi:hypothetical protein
MFIAVAPLNAGVQTNLLVKFCSAKSRYRMRNIPSQASFDNLRDSKHQSAWLERKYEELHIGIPMLPDWMEQMVAAFWDAHL